MYVGQWTTFHGPVILTYILNTFWWRNVELKILIQWTLSLTYKYICRSVTYILWYSDSALYFSIQFDEQASFFGKQLLLWLLVLIWAIDLYFMFDMKIFVNIARLEIGQLFTEGMKWGHPCTLDTFQVTVFFFLLKKCLCFSNTQT